MVCVYIYIYVYNDVFLNFVLYVDVGVIRLCIVSANGCIYVVLGENWVFKFSDPNFFNPFGIMLGELG
jgi:hypothetical protein